VQHVKQSGGVSTPEEEVRPNNCHGLPVHKEEAQRQEGAAPFPESSRARSTWGGRGEPFPIVYIGSGERSGGLPGALWDHDDSKEGSRAALHLSVKTAIGES